MTDIKENTSWQGDSREIKFRAWDKVCDNIYYFDIYDLERSIPYIYRDKVESEENITLPPRKEYIMQYTWLKDSDWVEIYEGDIVKSLDVMGDMYWFDNKWNRHLNCDCWIWEIERLDCWLWYISWQVHNWLEELIDNWHEIEIIWNIYENPELLSEK